MKKLSALIACLLVGLITLGSAWAVQWVEMTQDTDGSIYYVDRDSIYQGFGNKIYYWTKVVHKNINNLPGQTIIVNGKRVWYSKALQAEDCKAGLAYGYYQLIAYGLHHEVLYTGKIDYPSGSIPVPESIGATHHNVICAYWETKDKPTSP